MTIRVGDPTGEDCLHCGKAVIRRARTGPVPRYCSDECRSERSNEIQSRKARAARQEMVCEWCDAHIPDRGVRVRYCNKTCSKAAHHAKRMADPESRRRFLDGVRDAKRAQRAREKKLREERSP